MGGFQLEFVGIIRVKNHMTCYEFECSHWWKMYLKKNPLQNFLSSLMPYQCNVVTSTLISNLVTDYIQKRRGEPGNRTSLEPF